MSDRARRWLVVLACTGLVAAASSTYVHMQILGDPGYTSFCDINTTVSCTQVYQSRYGAVLGVPVALGGVVWFVGVLLLAYAGRRAPEQSARHVAGYLLVWSTLGLAVAMYMAYASFFVLKTVCVLCVVVYGTVIGIFVLSGNGPATPMAQLPAAMVRDVVLLLRRPVGLTLLIVFIAGTAWSMSWFAGRGAPSPMAATADAVSERPPPAETADQQTEFERYWESQPRVSIDLPQADDVDARAVVTVVKFNDYQCPACANAHVAYQPIFDKYESSHPGQVRQQTLDYPLDPECNDQAPNGQHGGACEAAVAVRLAAESGPDAREAMEEWLYANQPGLSREAVVQALERIVGIDGARYDAGYDRLVGDVRADVARGNDVPVEATPTYVINGVVIKGSLAPQFFDAAIAYELERAGNGGVD